jgi:hypothetical protein
MCHQLLQKYSSNSSTNFAGDTPKKLPKVIALDSDDEDENPSTPGAAATANAAALLTSPFGSVKAKPAQTNYAMIFNVVPSISDATVSTLENPIPLPVYGMAVVVIGRNVEYPFIQPVQENMTDLIEASHVLDKRFDYAPHGKVVKGCSAKGYNTRCLIWIPKPGALKLTQETCENIFNHWIQLLVLKNLITAAKAPTIHQLQGYTVVPSWNYVISCKDYSELYDHSYLSSAHTLANPEVEMAYKSFKTCCRYNNNTLYSFFKPGEVAEVFPFLKQYRLRDYLKTEDQALYNQLDPDSEVKVVEVKPEPNDDAKQAPASSVPVNQAGSAHADGQPVILEITVEDPDGNATVKRSLEKQLEDTDPEDEDTGASTGKGAKSKKFKKDGKKKGN